MAYVEEDIQQEIRDHIIREGHKIAADTSVNAVTAVCSTDADPCQVGPSNKRKKLGSLFRKDAAECSSAQTPKEKVELELTLYLNQSQQPDAESDPLTWWQVQETNFPTLSVLAKKYLCY